MSTIRAAVIGVGNMGTAHAVCLSQGRVEGMTLAALCDVDEARRAELKEMFPGVPCYASVEELLAAGAADAAIVATPHPCHSDVAEKTLAAGLHTLVEKPVDIAVSRARQLCEAADRSDRVVAVMLNQRTNPLFRKARELVQGGALGKMKRTVWIITNWYRTQHYYDSGAWRATWAGEGGGVLLNQAPHNLDLWQWICGMPQSVTAYCDIAKYHNIEVEDDVTILTRYADGATGVFITSTGDAPGTNRLEVTMDGGKLVCDGSTLKMYKLSQDINEFSATYKGGFGMPDVTEIEVETDGENPQHPGVLRAFAAHILRGEPLTAEGYEGINGLTLSNAMHLSSWLGRAVTLPLDEELFLAELNRRRATSRVKTGAAVTLDTRGTYNEK